MIALHRSGQFPAEGFYRKYGNHFSSLYLCAFFLIATNLQVVFVVGLVFLAFQFIYLSLFLAAFLRNRRFSPVEPQPVSIIVCAHDEEANLRELVPLLLQQDHPQFEVIIVEDRCNDGTFDYLLEATKKEPLLKMVRVVQKPEHIHGKKYGLTLGIKAAQYDWVLLTDADCRPQSTQWVKRMSEQFSTEAQIVLGYSAYCKRPGLLNSFIRFETLLTGIQYIGFALLGKPYMGVGRNLAYRRSLFLDHKGFNNYLGVTGGDDDLFVNQHAKGNNTKVVLGKEALVYSKPKLTWSEFYYQKLRHLATGKHYKISTKLMLGFFSISWMATGLLVLPILLFTTSGYWLLVVFGIRWVLLTILIHNSARKMGDAFEAWKAPFLDFIYAFYYLVAGSVALVSKKVRWKKM